MTTRTDIHRPSAPEFDPEAYTCFGVFDMQPEVPDPGAVAHWRAVVDGLVDRGFRAGAGSSRQCGHCGAHIRYAALMVHEDAKQWIYVGEQCLDNRFALTKGEFAALREQARLNRDQLTRREKVDAFLAAHPRLAWLTYLPNLEAPGEVTVEDDYGYQTVDYGRSKTVVTLTRTGQEFGILSDMNYKLSRYAELSEKQVAFCERLLDRIEERWAAHEARDAEPKADVPTGRVELVGTVVGVKFVDAYFGYRETTTKKITVKGDAGWRVYVTCPDAIYDADRGDVVRLTAAVEASEDDASFGFGKRPTKAAFVSRKEAAE